MAIKYKYENEKSKKIFNLKLMSLEQSIKKSIKIYFKKRSHEKYYYSK